MGIVAGHLLFDSRITRRPTDGWGRQPTREPVQPRRCRNVHEPDCDGYLRVTDEWENGDTKYRRHVCTECYNITKERADNALARSVVYIQK